MYIHDPEVLAIEPDKRTYSESIFYKTKLFVSQNNVTSSEALRQHHLYRVKYSVTIFHTEKHKGFVNMLLKGKHDTVIQPLWGQLVKIRGNVSGDTIPTESTSTSEFRVGSKVLIYEAYDVANIAEVAEVGEDYIKVTDDISVMAGMYVIPTFKGYIKNIINTKYSHEHFIKGDILVEELQ
jgi:hypothetical protein